MTFSKPVSDLIRARFSCRVLAGGAIPDEKRSILREAAESLHKGPMGSALRFRLIASEEGDSLTLKGLGTYGFIRDPSGFLLGAVQPGEKDLEDFGWGMEGLVLLATDLGLGTCWLGGFFTRGSFSRRIELGGAERMPAVVSVGLIGDEEAARGGLVRRVARGHRRLPWESLFFDGGFEVPLTRESAGNVTTALEMVRLAPSASNKQPWRVMRAGRDWHFFLLRTPGYNSGIGTALLGVEDLQRTDMGIAMCHFELAMMELDISGRWDVRSPGDRGFAAPAQHLEYIVTWEG